MSKIWVFQCDLSGFLNVALLLSSFLGLWFVEIYLLIHPYQTHLNTWPSFVHNHLNGQVFAHLILRITWQKLLIWMISKDILIQISTRRGTRLTAWPRAPSPGRSSWVFTKNSLFFPRICKKTYWAELWFLDYFAIFCLFVWLKKVFVEPSGWSSFPYCLHSHHFISVPLRSVDRCSCFPCSPSLTSLIDIA